MRKIRKQAQKKFATSNANYWLLQRLVAEAIPDTE